MSDAGNITTGPGLRRRAGPHGRLQHHRSLGGPPGRIDPCSLVHADRRLVGSRGQVAPNQWACHLASRFRPVRVRARAFRPRKRRVRRPTRGHSMTPGSSPFHVRIPARSQCSPAFRLVARGRSMREISRPGRKLTRADQIQPFSELDGVSVAAAKPDVTVEAHRHESVTPGLSALAGLVASARRWSCQGVDSRR